MSIRLHVWGDYACFTRPELKVERYSYDVMTPSAARGILEAIYWHPGVHWHIHRIEVNKPIRFMSVERNEVTDKFNVRAFQQYERGKQDLPVLHPSECVAQRTSIILCDVDYVINASFAIDRKHSEEGLTDAKVLSIFNRRASKGQCFHHPYFGTREFPVEFELLSSDNPYTPDPTQIPADKDLGMMLLDLDFSHKQPQPVFFHALLKSGSVDVPNMSDIERVYR